MTAQLIPIAVIAIELGADVNKLVKQFGSSVVIDETTGLRAIPAERCRVYLAAHYAAVCAERERRAAEFERAKALDPIPAFRRRLRARPPATGDIPALAHMLASEHQSRPLDEIMRPAGSALTYHPLSRKGD